MWEVMSVGSSLKLCMVEGNRFLPGCQLWSGILVGNVICRMGWFRFCNLILKNQ